MHPLLFAFINFRRQQTQSAIPEVPQGLATDSEIITAKSLELIGQYYYFDAIINRLNDAKEEKTRKQDELEKELESVDIIYILFVGRSSDLYK